MNLLDWFRNVFVPKADEKTIAQLIFLYGKHCNPKDVSDYGNEFIKAKIEDYKKTEVKEDNI